MRLLPHTPAPTAEQRPPADPHALAVAAVAVAVGSALPDGLSEGEAARRLALWGPNRPGAGRRTSPVRRVTRHLGDPLVALLVAAATVAAVSGDRLEAVVIGAIIVINSGLGLVQELGAERAMRALSRQFTQVAVVVRDGVARELPAVEVVAGDLLVLHEGDRVVADARVVEATALELDESLLTGESFPSRKEPRPVPAASPLGDRSSMLFAGTGVTLGHGTALVTATGPFTELGQIAQLTAEARSPVTPLQTRMARLARQLALAGVVLTLLLAAAMLLQGSSLRAAFLVGVAVAVAAVPEGLAATVTAALALGGRELARRGAIVRRLDAIETLGAATVVCTDKTGTLTENRIRVASLASADGVSETELLAAAVLSSPARRGAAVGTATVGDPVDRALLLAAMERGLSHDDLRSGRQRVHEVPFDSNLRRSAVVYAESDGRSRLVVKGAPEVLAALAAEPAPRLARLVEEWAGEGLRVLAVADRWLAAGEPAEQPAEGGLRLLGVVALHDPLRETVADAVAAARAAGIEVRLVTGDHAATANSVARSLGIPVEAVLARATPADKLRLVESLQARGEVVAVTGDGVNDAPALRRANVGIAMGRSGTEAAREAAGIVLTDDDFSTIVRAVEEGRRVSDNIRSFVAFLLSANLGEVLLFAVAIVAGLGTPLSVVQVLLVNLVTDGLPAAALAHDAASPHTMTRPPRRALDLLDRGGQLRLLLGGSLVGLVALGAFLLGRESGNQVAQTMAFATVALAELGFVYTIRAGAAAAWQMAGNRWLEVSVAASALFVVAAIYVPVLREVFSTVSLTAGQAAVVLGLAAGPTLAMEVAKQVLGPVGRRRGARAGY